MQSASQNHDKIQSILSDARASRVCTFIKSGNSVFTGESASQNHDALASGKLGIHPICHDFAKRNLSNFVCHDRAKHDLMR